MEDKKIKQVEIQEEKPLKKKLAIVIISLFMAILILPTAVWGAIGLFSKQTQDALNFDTGENRNFAEFPSEFDMQEFPMQVQSWYNDHLPFRSLFYSAQNGIKNWIEKAYKNALLPPVQDPDDNTGEGTPEEPAPLPDFPLIFNNATKKVFYGRGDWLFYGAENSLDYYQGTNLMDDEELAKETASLVRLKELCDQRGIELKIFIAPNKERVYSEQMPTVPVVSEQRRVDKWVQYIKENTDVEVVFPIQEILNAKIDAQLYYKYDTHWNEAGAFIGTKALYSSLGIQTSEWGDLLKSEYSRATGDLLNMGDIDKTQYTKDKGYNVTYKSYIKATSYAGLPLEGQEGTQTRFYQSNSTNDKKLFMVGDSFRSSMLPYMQKDFSFITATGRLYLEQTDVVDALLSADVLVVEAVERYDFTISIMAEMLIKILEA